MANTHVLNKLAGDLRSSSGALIERIAESRRKAHEAVLDLRDLEEAIKARIREERERAASEEAEALQNEAAAEPEVSGEASAVQTLEWKEGPAPEKPRAKAKKKPEPAPEPAEQAAEPKEPAAPVVEKAEPIVPEPEKPAAKYEQEEAPKAEKPPAKPAEPPKERIFMPKPDDRPRPSYGRTEERFVPRPAQGTFTPRVGANGPFIPKPRPEGGYPPRVGANGPFIPKPRPEGAGPAPRPGGYRPGGYGARPVTEKDIKKQLLVTPTQQKERVSNYDPNKTDLKRRERVAESQAEDKKNRNKRVLLTEFVPGSEHGRILFPAGLLRAQAEETEKSCASRAHHHRSGRRDGRARVHQVACREDRQARQRDHQEAHGAGHHRHDQPGYRL